MRAFGINYDTGFLSGGTTTHEPFLPDIVQREMRVIREDLRCEAVRVTGGDADRLETAARAAADAGLEVWYAPFTNGLTQDELLAFLLDAAERAERLRRDGARVVFLTGSEITLFTDGFLPGDTLRERSAHLADPAAFRALLPQLDVQLNAFLARVVNEVRARFGGPVGYASLAFEGVDWTPFDIAATDAGYRDATNAESFPDALRAQVARDKPLGVTEFGCGTFRGAYDLGGRGDSIVEWGDDARPLSMAAGTVRDEREQASYIREMLHIYDTAGVDAAFVYTFARRDLATTALDDPEHDFDAASFGVVRILPPGTAQGPYAGLGWEPKAAFHVMAEFGRARAEA
ncbi:MULTISPECIES: hypothetical protein [Streptomycetaceae]|nr:MULTISPECIES: hypothetical protein [Streptomycetaceae]MYS57351.1 hypothetical protein [Streptomyces sp. SID5468]CCB72923.1 conserved protein of unknown function [Streptantibioticus cattleyicolor NRRL 8057 = DSM 46488]